MNLLGGSERYLARRNALHGLLYYLFISFTLFLVAYWTSIANSDYTEAAFKKKIGLYWSINWTLTFLLIYPIFIFVAINATKDIRTFWRDLADWQIVTGNDGAKKASDALLVEWNNWLRPGNIVTILFSVISIAIIVTDFIKTAAEPILHCAISFPKTTPPFNAPIDWATIRVVLGTCQNAKAEIFISVLLLHILMLGSLIFYLAFLYYSATVFNFLLNVSRRDGDGRLIFRKKQLRDAVAPIIENLMICVVLGLSVCALMQAHYAYLRSSAADPIAFLTSDVEKLKSGITWLLGQSDGTQYSPEFGREFLEYQRAVISKGLNVIPLVVTILLVGLSGIIPLYSSVRNSLLYTLEKSRDIEWCRRVGLEEIDIVDLDGTNVFSAFWGIFSPYAPIYLLICAFLVLSIIMSSVLIFLASAVVVLMFRTASKYLLPAK